MSYNDSLIIPGGQIPTGEVSVSGAKNSATRLLSAATICDEEVTLTNYPINLVDSKHKVRFLKSNGLIVEESTESIIINSKNYSSSILNDFYYPIRTTYLLVAGQLKKSGIAYIPYPGGCNIGKRKYDIHIMVWESFGCAVEEKENYIQITSPKKLKGTNISFPISTVGGTENALLCASIAEGKTRISNAYITPEIEDLISFLKIAGVNIVVINQSYIEIIGSDYLKGQTYSVMPDRIEALTWIVYAAISRGKILIKNIPFDSMKIPLMYLKSAGLNYYENSNDILITPACLSNGNMHAFEIACGTHPGIISDMQPFYVMLGLKSLGTTRIHDYRYPERISYINELQRFVSKEILSEPGKITVTGPVEFKSAEAKCTDLRGTMASVLAALCAPEGISKVEGVSMALRGYNNLIEKLASLNIQTEYKK
ncbi:UDP-N-acetylglucosamine 1-carboxyvinyltransferase [Providencia alcalifaciens]|uniref:UDP-N-acetylglucosamine 1-carboxyvinyltransferase n=1 Tax=Providencia alcalifaciens TaxID=126385 RepID=UPI002275A90F|nr:UDP-N-acetylglucosamine 1-carboxyvinyltransferase [Providencia rettgeri]MCY0803022.1 UDP-N-acetylglucosamine 1-carboxyvinyltransferase [Providencia rettgeri]